jgi:cytochrome o ubiquinol oxidase subunit II
LRFIRKLALASPLALTGCSFADFSLLNPAGPMARAEYHYTLALVGVMLIIILPTLVMTILFPLRYHHSRKATYRPDWSFSLPIEILAWGIPLGIVVVLCFLTVSGVYAVDPWNPGVLPKAAAATDEPAINVEVIATDWQWVFIYPDEKIATIDELVVPAGRRVNLKMTATSNMNGFYIPAVAPMVDAMPAMQTRDAFIIDNPGHFTGFSTDFSGAGFSWMQFSTRAVSDADYAAWVKTVQATGTPLDYAAFDKTIAPPKVNYGAKPSYYTLTDPGLFGQVIMAAMMGKTYPVPDTLTESVDTGAAPASP